MTPEAITTQLAATRPDGSDDDLPEVVEACQKAAADAELSAWLEQERAFDTAMQQALVHAVPLPLGLRESLQSIPSTLAAGTTTGTAIPFPIEEPRSRGWQPMAWMPLAACLVLLLSLSALFFNRPASTVIDSQLDVVAAVEAHFQHDVRLGVRSPDLGTIRNYLVQNGGAFPADTPQPLLDNTARGCVVLDWRDAKISMICWTNDVRRHLYLIPKSACKHVNVPTQPEMTEHGNQAMIRWADDDTVFVLMTEDCPKKELEQVYTSVSLPQT